MKFNWIFRIGAALFILLGALVVAGILFVRSAAFHRYLLATAIERAEKATGGRVEIGDFTIHWPSLDVDLYRVALHGTESDPDAPLFWSDQIGIGLTLVSIWNREIDLREIVADHPVIHLLVDKQGRTNIPTSPPPPPGAKPFDVFELAIGRFNINHGEIYYNDRRTPLDAEIRDLQTQVSFGAIKKVYDGTLSYREGRLRYGDYNPLQHGLEAQFEATPSGLTLKSLRLISGSSRVALQASLQDYQSPTVEGSYDADISMSEGRKILKIDSLPSGQLSTKGSFHYRSDPSQPFLASLSVEGQLSSPAVGVASPEARANIRAVKGEYRLNHGNFEARNVQADALGGHLTAELSVQHLGDKPEGRIEGALRNISLSAASSALSAKPLQGTGIQGSLDGTVNATWRGSKQALQVRADATVTAEKSLSPDVAAGQNAVPVDGSVHLAYSGGTNVISLERTYLKTPHTSVSLEGTLASQSSIQIQAQSDDLHEVDVLAAAFQKPAAERSHGPATAPQLLGLGGSATFNGQVQGTTKEPRLTGQLSGQNISYQGTSLRILRTQVIASPSSVALHQGQLQTGPHGSVQFDVTAGLTDWSYGPQSPITLRATANNLPLTDVQRFARVQYPVSGILSANISIQGTQTNPTGQGSLRLSGANVWDQPVQDFTVQFDGNGSVLHATASMRTPAGSASAKVTYEPKNEGYDAQLDLPRLQIDQLQAVRARNLELAGVVTVSARGRGTFKTPQLEATIEAPKLQIRQQAFDGLKAHGTLAEQQAAFTVNSSASGVSFEARGTVKLNSEYDAMANIDTRTFELGPLLGSSLQGHARDVHGRTEVHGSLQGPLKHPERVEAHVELPTLDLGYQSLQLANASPLRINYRSGILTLERAELKGTGTDLQLQAVVPVTNDGAVRGTVAGDVDLHIVQLFNRDIESSGQAKLNVNAQGTRSHPVVQGVLRVIDGAFQAPDAPLGAEKVNAEFEVLKDRVNIKSFSAQSGGGAVTAKGYAVYQPSVQFNVGLNARGVRLRYPEGVRALLTSDLTLSGTPESAMLNGQVLINRVSFTQSFDLASFAGQFTGPSTPPSAGIAQKIKLNVALKSTRDMDLSSSKLSVTGSADLTVRGTVAEPVIVGMTNITGGELFFNARRYEIESGVVQFANPVRTEPVVNLHVTTTVNQFNITMILVGPIDRMRTSYTSDPPLPPVDVINLLLTGHTTEAASSSPTTPQSVLAGQMAGQVSSRVEKLAGISALTIDPQMGGNGTNPGASLAIQQRVTKNLFFTFATDVTNTQNPAVQVEYQVTRKFSMSALRDQNGSYSLQIKMRKKF